MMRPLSELVVTEDRGIDKIHEWIGNAENECDILPPSAQRDKVLLETQVTTRSTMGAIAYETGGILVDKGWLRFLWSGHPRLSRTLNGWNHERAQGLYLVADDAVGGFFAINGGAFGPDVKNIYYWAPDALDWEPLDIGFTDFFAWTLSNRLAQFYESLRWSSWRDDMINLSGDQCFSFYPFLWTKEGSILSSHREPAPVQEVFDLKMELARQLG